MCANNLTQCSKVSIESDGVIFRNEVDTILLSLYYTVPADASDIDTQTFSYTKTWINF